MSFGFLMARVLAATPAKLTKLQTFGGRFLILGSDVVAAFAIRALKYNIVARHNSNSPIPISDLRSDLLYFQIPFSSDLSLVQIFAS